MGFWDEFKEHPIDKTVDAAQQVYKPVQEMQNFFDQKARDMVVSHLLNKDVNGISENDYKTEYLKAMKYPNDQANRDMMDIRYEPAVAGTVREVGKGAELATQLARNIRNESQLIGQATRPNLGFGSLTVKDIPQKLGKIIFKP